MFQFRAAVLLLAAASAAAVTPVEKVISLLEDLKTEVETEGKNEATVYDEFACFCKDTSTSKSDAIIAGRDNIDSLSATIGAKTAAKEEKQAELAARKADQEAMSKELQETEARYAKEKAEYEATAADLSKALSSLESAIKAMEGSKPASLLAIRESVEQSLAIADALNLVTEARRQAVSAFLQVDPSDPMYKYHSQGIIETLETLLKEFTAEKKQLDDDWAQSKATFESTIKSLNSKLEENKKAMDQLEADIETLKGDIAEARENLVNAEATLKDDQLYMKDLTERCEVRSKDWDQRSQLRAGELEALTGALDILTSKVSGLDTDVNKRALLLQRNGTSTDKAASNVSSHPAAKAASLKSITKHAEAVSFLQDAIVSAGAGHSQLRGAASLSARQVKVVALLGKEGKRLGSSVLSTLAISLADDPFLKVKTLIQQLVERLIAEATSEATKKGFCDEKLGMAHKDRDYRMADAKSLDVEIQSLETKLIELEEEIEMLKDAIKQLAEDLRKATELREREHEENLDIMKKAGEGFQAVDEALKILKVFYKQSAKAKVLLQASPVDEDTAGAGFKGAYKGKQESSNGIIGMLEVIKSDFDRTDRTTEAAEKQAHEQFVEFDRSSRADISGKEMKQALDEEDAETTKNTISEKTEDLKTAQELLDSALKQVEDLKPTCIDTGMSFEERVAKREEELAALKNALCILDADGVEADCQGQGP
mmetsp:Transcript_53192/g.152435  ORF Transcript_53192/g.152435 Transcript_53192/m.152435 type:complete len:716 (-) Transcript_53192:65-2212(-)